MTDADHGDGRTNGDTGQRNAKDPARGKLSDEDESVFRVWHEGLVMQDGRYNSKGLAVLVRAAMVDADFRRRLIDDTDGVVGKLRKLPPLPEGVSIRFHDNDESTLNVVLPPAAGATALRSPALREALKSRTAGEALFRDDWDTEDILTEDLEDEGDPHTRDGSIFKTA